MLQQKKKENAIIKVINNFHMDKIVMDRDIGLIGLIGLMDNLWIIFGQRSDNYRTKAKRRIIRLIYF